MQLARCLQQHAGARLAARAILVRPVRANVNAIDAGARLHKLRHKLRVDMLRHPAAQQAAPDGGLVGDNHHGERAAGQPHQCGQRAGKQLQLLPSAHILGAVFIDDAVAIQKNCCAQSLSHHAQV